MLQEVAELLHVCDSLERYNAIIIRLRFDLVDSAVDEYFVFNLWFVVFEGYSFDLELVFVRLDNFMVVFIHFWTNHFKYALILALVRLKI